jgi:D-glycero-alpha-D-manno-heptose-7-phosphate kinase
VIISRTPVRISFLGGGTDYPDWFRAHGGQTLGATIDKYSYLTVNRLAPLFDYSIRVSYSRLELVDRVDDLQHPAVRECLRFLGIPGRIEINYVGDLPARSGLGSSSSFTVGLLQALHAFKGDLVSREQLAREAVIVEHELIRERVGVQDQYTCAHGGLLHLAFGRDGTVDVRRVPLGEERVREIEDHLMLLYTGVQRNAHDLLGEQLERTRSGEVSTELHALNDLVDRGIEVLTGRGPVAALGELLHAGWVHKKALSSRVSGPQIDELYDRARGAGAVGGKLLGAGGGGFLLLVAPPERQAAVLSALAPLARVPFRLEFGGASLLFYQPSGG